MATKKEGYVSFFVPRDPSNDDPNLYICIQGTGYLLPKGQTVEVPKAVVNEYQRSLEAKENLARLNADLEKQSKTVQGA